MATNEKRRAAMRRRILAAATELFMANGYKQTNISDIAARANVSQVTLYKYFVSKLELGHQVVLMMIRDGYRQYQQVVDDSTLSFQDLVKKMIQESTGMARQMSDDFYQFVVQDMRGELGFNETLQVYQDGMATFWGALIARGREAGLIQPTISNQALMLYLDMFIQYVQHPQNSALFTNQPMMMKLISEELVHLFFYGFIGREEGKLST